MRKVSKQRLICFTFEVKANYKGKFICNRCGKKRAWRDEIYTIQRCRDSRCNGQMKLHLYLKGGK